MGSEDGELLAGRYRVGELLGSGGAAQVHRAWDERLGRPVAVKTFRGVPDAVELVRFDNEIHTLATLSHPGLVEVYDAGVEGSQPYVVLELIEGGTLRERIADGPLSVAETARLGGRLAEALAYVHKKGVTHRDVKPSNILLDADGLPHLVDFGVARLVGSEHITATNQMIGTAAYLAPEQVRGGTVDTRADIYALGLVLLECVTGSPEYQGTDVESAIARLHRPPAIPPELPVDLTRLLALMTSLSPNRRPTARECADVLAHLPGDATNPELEFLPWTDEPTVTPTPSRKRSLVAALGLVAAAGTAVWNLAGSVHSEVPASEAPTSAVATATAVAPPQAAEPDRPSTEAAHTPTARAVLNHDRPTPGETRSSTPATTAQGNQGKGNSGKDTGPANKTNNGKGGRGNR